MARMLWIAGAAVVLAACGGGGGGGSVAPPPPPPPPPANDSPGGLWGGNMSFDGGDTVPVVGIVTETGEYRFIGLDGQQVFGDLTVTGSTLAGTGSWVLPPDTTTAGGSEFGETVLSGTVQERASISGNFTSTGNLGDTFTGSVSLVYDEDYERPSSLAIIAGTYTAGNEALAIDTQGEVFIQAADSGCVGNGSVAVLDSRYAVYGVSFELESCTGEQANLNGQAFSGLAILTSEGGTPDDTLIMQVDTTFADMGFLALTIQYQR